MEIILSGLLPFVKRGKFATKGSELSLSVKHKFDQTGATKGSELSLSVAALALMMASSRNVKAMKEL